jgi:sterol desaturase/sphingolipid hydroxylase (fatty acid hydroxylase superfamily)
MKKLPSWASAPLIAGTFLWLLREERRRPLRAPTQPKTRRLARNLALAASGAVALAIVERPLIGPLARFVERKRWGRARLPPAVAAPLAIAALDYTLYVWHMLTHRVPALWRFHLVHYADVDMDASTALRFHSRGSWSRLACTGSTTRRRPPIPIRTGRAG